MQTSLCNWGLHQERNGNVKWQRQKEKYFLTQMEQNLFGACKEAWLETILKPLWQHGQDYGLADVPLPLVWSALAYLKLQQQGAELNVQSEVTTLEQ